MEASSGSWLDTRTQYRIEDLRGTQTSDYARDRLGIMSEDQVSPHSPWLTTDEAAAYLKVHPETIRRFVRNGMLQKYSFGDLNTFRYHKKNLDALLVPVSSSGSSADAIIISEDTQA